MVALSIVIMTMDHRYRYLDGARDVLATAIYPLQYLARLPGDAKTWLTENLVGRGVLLEEMPNCAKSRCFSTPSCRN